MANEFKVKNGLIVIGDLTTSGTITINGALAATQSWVTSQAYLTSASLSGYATQSYVTSAIASLVDSAPAALDTLKELATALGNDASFATTVTNSIASKLSLSGGTMTGQILFQTSALNNGFRWDVNSDAAGITFKNTGDGDNNSYFNFFTEDNGNEYFKFSHNTWNIGSFDFMDVKNGVIRTNGDIYVNASQSGTRSAGTNELINGSRVWHAGDFSSTNISNWNTAYSWGNHATAGYLTSVSDVWVNTTGDTMTGSLTFANNADGVRLQKGSSFLNLRDQYNNIHLYNAGDGTYIDANIHYWRSQGATYWMTLSSTGLGIGTGSPSYKLDVAGSIRTQDGYIIGANGNADITIDGNIGSQLRYGTQKILLNSADAYIYTNNIARVFVNNAGDVGIGTTGPTYKLDVNGSIRTSGVGGLYIDASANFGDNSGAIFDILNLGSTRALRILATSNNGWGNILLNVYGGNVGIGTVSPSYKLDVSGTARFTQSISLNQSAVIKKRFDSGTNNPVKTASGVLASRSDNGGGSTYYVIETNVPQDDYQMGGFTIELFGNYSSTNHKTKIDLGGYWNAEANGGFIGFEAHGSNPQYKPTIEVARNTSTGNTAFIIYGLSWNYPVIVARDLWLGYTVTDGGAYGEGWSIVGTETISGYSNRDTVVWRNAYSDSNPAGYITGYTETDTLASVTGRGASTTTALTINADEGLKVIYNGNGGDTWIRGWGIESNRGAVYLRPTTNNTQTLFIGYIDGNQNWGSISVGSAAFTWNGAIVATRTWVSSQNYLTSYTETDTLQSVTSRGATTNTLVSLNSGLRMGNAYLTPSGDQNHFHFDGTAIIPNSSTTANNASMGTNTYRWSSVYGGYGYFSENVGIGTTSPIYKLHVSTGNTNVAARLENTTSNGSVLELYSSGDGRLMTLQTDHIYLNGGALHFGAENGALYLRSSGYGTVIGGTTVYSTGGNAALSVIGDVISFGASNSELSYFRRVGTGQFQWQTYSSGNNGQIHLQPYGGNVGIGTTSPNYKLDVNGSINIYTGNSLRWGSGDAEIINSGYNLLFKTYNGSVLSETMRINSAGKVSIGTTDTNSDKSDFTVYTGSGASIALVDDQVRMGGADVNWGVALRSYGSLQTYGQTLNLTTQAGNYPVIIQPNGVSSVSFYQSESYINTYTKINYNWGGGDYGAEQLTIRGQYPSITLRSTNANFKWLLHTDSSGYFRWYTGSEADNNAWTNRFSFGTDNNFYVESGHVYVSGGNSTQWNTAYSWGNHASAGYQPAATAINTSNIGSQSVNYATSAGYAGYVNNQSGQLVTYDNRTISPSETNAGYLQFGFTSWTNDNNTPYADYLHLRSYTDGSGGSDNLVMFLKSGIGMRIYQQTFGSASAYSSYADVWTSANFTSTNVSNWNTAYGWGNHASQGYATTSYVTTQINNLINGAPGVLDTLDELAAALGDDANFATTVTNSIAGKVSKSGDTMTGDLVIGVGASTGSSQPFGDFSQLRFDNLHSDTNRGPNKIVMHDNGSSWIGGFGIHSDTVSYYTGGHHRWYKTDSQTSSSQVMQLDPSGNLTLAGTLSASGYNKSNWDTAYSWGNHASAGYAAASSLANYLPLAGGTMSGGLNFGNNDIYGVNNLRINDPGVGEGITWESGNGWGIFECPDVFDNTAGNLQFALNATTRLMTLNTAGALWIAGALTEASSLKLKENVETSEGNLEKVVNLRPVTYNKIGSQTTELGLIAEEVAEVYPEFVQHDENGEPVGVHYSRLTAALIGAVKELTNQVQELNKKING